jgi:tetratricopeptide (TPR) repeat protein
MRLGFAAMYRKEYLSATEHFRDALFYVPEDREATIAYWNARKALHGQTDPAAAVETPYDRDMRIGYHATRKRDYQTALINFRRALQQRPGDAYATQAIRNVTSYIAGKKGQPLGSIDSLGLSTADGPYIGESTYDRYMRLGYAAAKERNFQLAANYFSGALADRPGDRLATIAFWNCKHNLLASGASASSAAANYQHHMRAGYDATQRHQFHHAQQEFQAALAARPGDPYASQGLKNVTTYIRQGGMP